MLSAFLILSYIFLDKEQYNMKNILVLQGPNLNMVGIREKGIYGEESSESINDQIVEYCKKQDYACDIYQSNWEGALIDKIHEAKGRYDGAIINAGALTHYSYSIRDAISAVKIPFVEVHMSNVFSREEFRHKSVIGAVCAGQIAGFGKRSYFLAVDALKDLI